MQSSITLYTALPTVASIYFLAIGSMVFFKGKKTRVLITFFLLCVSTGFWQGTWAILFFFNDPNIANFLIKFGYLVILFLPTFMYHFLIELSERKQEATLLKISYAINFGLSIALIGSPLFINGYYSYFWGFYPKAGILHPIHVIQTSAIVLRGAYILAKKRYEVKRHDPLYGQQLLYGLFGLLIYSVAAVDYACNYGYEFYPPGVLFISIYLTILAIAITKHRMMDISVVISKATAWTIATSIYVGSYLSTLYVIRFFYPIHINYIVVATSLGFGVLLANSFQRFRLWIQTTTDKAFLRHRYTYSKGIQFYTEAFSRCTDLPALKSLCEEIFPKDFEIKSAHLLMPQGFVDQQSFDRDLIASDLTISSDSELYKACMTHPVIIRTNTTPEVATEMKALGAYAAFSGIDKNRITGLVLLGKKLSEEPFTNDDINFLSVLGVQIGVVTSRLRQSRKLTELVVAQRIQTELLPENITVPGLDIACCMVPASEMGGDFYDIQAHPTNNWLIVGDVTGHGVASAMVTFMAQSMIATLLDADPSQPPTTLLANLNNVLTQNMKRLEQTLPIALIALSTPDGRTFKYCGFHDNIILIRHQSGDAESLAVDQAPFALGIETFPVDMYLESELILEPDDLLFISTDGIVESTAIESNGDEYFGEERLITLLKSVAHLNAEEIKEKVLEELDSFRGKNYLDDVTFMIVKIQYPPGHTN